MPSLAPIRMYRGIPPINLLAVVYDVPAGKRAIIKHVRITNAAVDDAWLTMLIGLDPVIGSQGHYFTRELMVKAGDVVIFEMNEVMNDTEFIWVKQGTADALYVQISGVEVTL